MTAWPARHSDSSMAPASTFTTLHSKNVSINCFQRNEMY